MWQGFFSVGFSHSHSKINCFSIYADTVVIIWNFTVNLLDFSLSTVKLQGLSLWFNLRMNKKVGLRSQTKYFWNLHNEEYSKSSKIFKLYDGLFLKSRLSKMASTKTNKQTKRTPLFYSNFLRYTTLLCYPKRFLNSKGLKNDICLWLRLGK